MKSNKTMHKSKKDNQVIASYYQKYQQKGKNMHDDAKKSTQALFKKWNESEISHRRDKIMNLVQNNRDASLIRIEDSITNSLKSKNI